MKYKLDLVSSESGIVTLFLMFPFLFYSHVWLIIIQLFPTDTTGRILIRQLTIFSPHQMLGGVALYIQFYGVIQ